MISCLDRLQDWLREQHVPYQVQYHRPAYTIAEVAAEVPEPPQQVAKVVIASVDDRLVMLVVPASEHVDFAKVARLLEAQSVAAAREDEFEARFPDCELGSMPPFGVHYDMPTYIDETLTRTREIVFQAGTHRHTLKLATDDYLRLAQPHPADLTKVRAQPVAG